MAEFFRGNFTAGDHFSHVALLDTLVKYGPPVGTGRRHECRRGTQECVRYVKAGWRPTKPSARCFHGFLHRPQNAVRLGDAHGCDRVGAVLRVGDGVDPQFVRVP